MSPVSAALVQQLDLLDRVSTPMWIYDLDAWALVWANQAALPLWGATDREHLLRRDVRPTTVVARDRLVAIRERLAAGERFTQVWTNYPAGIPLTTEHRFSPWPLDDGHLGALIEASDPATKDPLSLRSADILQSTHVLIATYALDGAIIVRNGAAIRAFGPPDLGADAWRHVFVHADDAHRIWAIAQGGGVFAGDVQCLVHGAARWHHVEVRPMTDSVSGQPVIMAIHMDVEDRVSAIKYASAQADFVRRVIDQLPALVFIKNREGRFTLVNQAMADDFGTTVAALTQSNNYAVHDDKREVESYLANDLDVITTGKPLQMEEKFTRPNGEVLWYLTTKSALRQPTGEVDVLGVSIDITARRAMEDELREARERAEAASLAKGRFLATMSHEIRTPLAGMTGMAELLRDSSLDPDQRGWARSLCDASKHLRAIIDDVLDFSRLESDRMRLEEVAYDPHEVIERCVGVLRITAQSKDLPLHVDIAPDLPTEVLGDPTRLQQVLLNLLGNAIKFTAAGSITLRACVLPGLEGQRLFFSVRDTGIGLELHQIDHLFEPFTQAESSTTRRYGGSGLGLAISQSLVRLMGGRITVDSTPGVGAEFAFQLPLRLAKPRVRIDSQPLAASSQHWQLLVADDTPIIRAVFERNLKRRGHTVTLVEDGLAAVEAVAAGYFDAVLLDLHMPRMDGRSAAREMRAQKHENLAILLVTADVVEDQQGTGNDPDIDGFLGKPVDWNALDGLLSGAIASRKARTPT